MSTFRSVRSVSIWESVLPSEPKPEEIRMSLRAGRAARDRRSFDREFEAISLSMPPWAPHQSDGQESLVEAPPSTCWAAANRALSEVGATLTHTSVSRAPLT
jgi:hypothetical protein